MKTTKKIDLGEYIVVIEYNDTDSSLYVTVLDELEGVIEAIKVTNDEDDEAEGDDDTYKLN
jgi:nitrate reductase NapAB chaperone NapD